MIKGLLGIFTLAILFGSCNKQKGTVRIQLIRVRGVISSLANELNKGYCAEYYIDYKFGDDSLLIYINPSNSLTGDLENESVFKLYVNDNLKKTLQDVQFISDTISSGILSSLPKNSEDTEYLYHDGVYMLSVNAGTSTKYFSFIKRNTTPFELFVGQINEIVSQDIFTNSIQSTVKLNIDSVVFSFVSLPGMDSVYPSPPIKSTVKFTPPQINENE